MPAANDDSNFLIQCFVKCIHTIESQCSWFCGQDDGPLTERHTAIQNDITFCDSQLPTLGNKARLCFMIPIVFTWAMAVPYVGPGHIQRKWTDFHSRSDRMCHSWVAGKTRLINLSMS